MPIVTIIHHFVKITMLLGHRQLVSDIAYFCGRDLITNSTPLSAGDVNPGKWTVKILFENKDK